MAKHIYLLEIGNLSKLDNTFYFYDKEPFTSKKFVNERIARAIECNKGTNVERETVTTGNSSFEMITYDSISTEDKPMRIRYTIRKLELNRY